MLPIEKAINVSPVTIHEMMKVSMVPSILQLMDFAMLREDDSDSLSSL